MTPALQALELLRLGSGSPLPPRTARRCIVIGGDKDVGETMIHDTRLPLISATGSTRMGKRVGQVVAGRLGRSLLELGGNAGAAIHSDANVEFAAEGYGFVVAS